MRFWRARCEHVLSELLSAVGLRSERQRLSWGSHFTGNITAWISPFSNRKQWLAVTSVEEIHESLFSGLCDRIYGTPPLIHCEECWWRRKIAVPNIVMYSLEMPDTLPRRGVESQETICKQIVTMPIATVEIKDSRTCWDIEDAPLFVQCHACPVIGRAGFFPCISWPGIVAEISRMGDGVKSPAQGARMHIEGANISRRRGMGFGIPPANYDYVLVN